MPNPAKSLGYIKCYSTTTRVAPGLLEALAILLDTTVRRSAADPEDLKSGNQKKGHISLGDQQSYYLQVFQRLN